jgi:hypothetical protein
MGTGGLCQQRLCGGGRRPHETVAGPGWPPQCFDGRRWPQLRVDDRGRPQLRVDCWGWPHQRFDGRGWPQLRVDGRGRLHLGAAAHRPPHLDAAGQRLPHVGTAKRHTPLQGTGFPALPHLQPNLDGRRREGTTMAGGARSAANIQKNWREQGRTSAGGRLGVRPRFAHTRGAGSIFQSDQMLGQGLGSCWTGSFSPNHTNFSFGSIISLLLEMLTIFSTLHYECSCDIISFVPLEVFFGFIDERTYICFC